MIVHTDREGYTVSYILRGTVEEIEADIRKLKGQYPTPGYGTWFHWPKIPNNNYLIPKDLGNDIWEVRGNRSTSCD